MTLNYACLVGRIKLALYDDRDESPDRRRGCSRSSSARTTTALVIIPPGRLERLQGHDAIRMRSSPTAAPTRTIPARSERLDPFENDIPYDWAIRHH